MVIVVLSFVMLGTVMLTFFSFYWQSDQKATLRKNADLVVAMCDQAFTQKEGGNIYADVLPFLLGSSSKTIEADIFITDLQGNVILGSTASEDGTLLGTIDETILDKLLEEGYYEEKGNLGGFYKDDYFVVGVSLKEPSETGSDKDIGNVFVAKTAFRFNAFKKEATQIFLIAALVTLAISFVVVGFFAYSLVRPLRQMSSAVNQIGSGDFSVRVPITSEDEIGMLAVSFNNMADSLAGSESMRRSFIANVSHELKTPMTTIAGFIDGILDGTIPEDKRNKYLLIVSEEVKRLSRLVKSMLDLSRIDSGEMRINPQKFDLPGMIVKILLTFERSVEEKHLDIRGLEDIGHITVYGDQDLLYQVIYNLIENAVKFTGEGGYIEFTITDSIDRTSVAIKNSGEGIVAEELPMIFDRFYKTDKSRSKDKKGIGLGLYIVKTIIKLHGGDISVSSRLGEYCRFEFYIPKARQDSHGKDGKERKDSKEFKELKDTKEFTVYDAEITSEHLKIKDDKHKE